MPAISVLIKPASSACNMNCRYCFYKDESRNREKEFQGMLSEEKMEIIVREAMKEAEGSCTFGFQGGEPTLAGLDFFEKAVQLEKKYAKPGVKVQNMIQTNGFSMDEDWAQFLKREKFLVGLSLDGPASFHNEYRVDNQDKGTFNRVMHAAALMDKYHVEYNVLCVVTDKNARSAAQLYRFYRKNGFRWLQFIPCMDPIRPEDRNGGRYLSAQEYGHFLVTLFDLWFSDLVSGNFVSIRQFDNWVSMLLGQRPEACDMTGHCSIQYIIEGDGGVYPCDFYVLDEWRLGTVGEKSFSEMFRSETAQKFMQQSLTVPEECRTCSAYSLCRNGCRRQRPQFPDGTYGRNALCEAYRIFFAERGNQLRQAAMAVYRSMTAQ